MNGFYREAQSSRLFYSLFNEPVQESISSCRGWKLSFYLLIWQGRVDLPTVSYVNRVPLTLSRPEDMPAECSTDCIVLTRDSRRVLCAPADCRAFAARLGPAQRIAQAVESQLALLTQAQASIGIHYRQGYVERTVNPPDPAWLLAKVRADVALQGLSDREVSMCVTTDCGAALGAFRAAFPCTVALPKEYRPNRAGPPHNGRDDLSAAERPDIAEGALADACALAGCDTFAGSMGNFSRFAQLLSPGVSTDICDGPRLFTDAQVPATRKLMADDEIHGELAARHALALDGLFVEDLNGVRHVRYCDTPMLDFTPKAPVGMEEQCGQLKNALRARRLY